MIARGDRGHRGRSPNQGRRRRYMGAKLKCSNCGEDITTFNMSWGWKHLLFMVPILLIGFLPMARLVLFKGNISKELVVSEVEKRFAGGNLEIVGLVTNNGSHDWSAVTIEAEFFDGSGVFLDEAQEYLRGNVSRGAKEHFKITIRNPREPMTSAESKMVVKISGGHSSPF